MDLAQATATIKYVRFLKYVEIINFLWFQYYFNIGSKYHKINEEGELEGAVASEHDRYMNSALLEHNVYIRSLHTPPPPDEELSSLKPVTETNEGYVELDHEMNKNQKNKIKQDDFEMKHWTDQGVGHVTNETAVSSSSYIQLHQNQQSATSSETGI